MPSLDDAAKIARELPEVTVGERHGHHTWFVAGKAFAWERPLNKADLKRLGDEPTPTGPILAVSTLDLEDRDAILASGFVGVFTIQHFEGYPAVLIQLEQTTMPQLRELILDAWLAKAPDELAAKHRPA